MIGKAGMAAEIGAGFVNSLGEGPSQGVIVELVMDSHSVVGQIPHRGAPRRLVDVLNTIDGGFLVISAGELRDPFRPEQPPRAFAAAQVHRDAILFAVPRGGTPFSGSPLEAVAKAPFPATIVLPGFEITGNVFLLPGADPVSAPLLANRHFIPMTDATIAASQGRDMARQEPLVIVNLTRALFYAPNTTKG